MNKIEHQSTPESTILKDGQFFLNKKDGSTYILAMIRSTEYALIGLNEGNRYSDPTKTPEGAFANDRADFALVTSPFTITPDT